MRPHPPRREEAPQIVDLFEILAKASGLRVRPRLDSAPPMKPYWERPLHAPPHVMTAAEDQINESKVKWMASEWYSLTLRATPESKPPVMEDTRNDIARMLKLEDDLMENTDRMTPIAVAKIRQHSLEIMEKHYQICLDWELLRTLYHVIDNSMGFSRKQAMETQDLRIEMLYHEVMWNNGIDGDDDEDDSC